MGSNFSLKYNVDIVMCIDATASMGSLIDTVKKNAINFYSDIKSEMEKKRKHIDKLRIRVIIFRDYIADGEDAMLATDFYTLPDDSVTFSEIVNSIEPFGGGDDPEDGLEALAYAIKSQWTTEGDKRRHIIIVWSDDSTHNIGFAKNVDNYPEKMASSFDELTEWWGDKAQPGIMDNSAKRLLIFAPDVEYWSTISDSWENVIHFPSEAGSGLQTLEYSEILNTIANSI